MALLSVIIPVYNSISTLERCVNSVLSQETDNTEVILVDDGSNDGSPDLCDRLAAKHSCIQVIHRENGGLSAARNTGIEASSGKWLSFVDSDDELSPDTLSANLEWLESHSGIDLLEFPVNVHYNSPDSFLLSFKPETITDGQVFRHWIESQGYNHCYACNKIYRRELFDSIRFPNGESFEDAAVCPAIIRNCKSMRYSDSGCYLYYCTEGGITNHYSFNTQEPLFRHNIDLLQEIRKQHFDEPHMTRLWNVCLNLLICLNRCKDADSTYIGSRASELDSAKPGPAKILHSGISHRQMIKALSAWFLGVDAVCRMLGRKKYT